MTDTLIKMERFWNKVDKTDDCWNWTASKNIQGYGYFRFDGKMRKAHRMAWLLVNGEIPDGMCVCHTCDNPGCVNPIHLWLGTNQDNMDDMNNKGRHYNLNQTHCKYGHEFSITNTYVYPHGPRGCRECSKISHRVSRAKKRTLIFEGGGN